MAKVVINLVTEKRSFPANTVGGLFRVQLTDAQGGVAFLEGAETSFAFEDVAAGTYSVLAALLDAQGAVLYAPSAKSITVAPADVQLDVPVDFSITVS